MSDPVKNATDQLIIELAHQGTALVKTIGVSLGSLVVLAFAVATVWFAQAKETIRVRREQVALSKENNELKKAASSSGSQPTSSPKASSQSSM
jgi:hypothetical protein